MSHEAPAPRDHVASNRLQVDPDVISELAAQLGDVVVRRVLDAIRAEGLTASANEPKAWLDANDVAKRLRVSREWVYEHAQELGAERIGTGPRPRLRFPPRVIEARDFKPPPSRNAAARSAQPQAKASGLIPIRGS